MRYRIICYQKLDYPIFQPKENGELLYKITASGMNLNQLIGVFMAKQYMNLLFNDVPTEFKVSSYQTFPGNW